MAAVRYKLFEQQAGQWSKLFNYLPMSMNPQALHTCKKFESCLKWRPVLVCKQIRAPSVPTGRRVPELDMPRVRDPSIPED